MEEENKSTTSEPAKAPDRIAVLEKIAEYEREGKFDIDVEDDPPQTRTLKPKEVDFLRKKLSSKIRRHFAYKGAKKFMNKMQDMKMLQVKEIVGIENLQNLKTGAIITCNHFNAFDSFITQIAFESAKLKHKKLYRIIREGNYTDFPGLFGFIMRNYNTLPLSSNKRVMVELMNAVKTILNKGDFVLIYPEQSMWWNYRKPKPLKDGAYKMAVKYNVPILPIFITMEDSDVMGPDGFPVQAHTVHIGSPIYLDANKDDRENVEYLRSENSRIWKEIYESTYNTKLSYTTK